MNIKILGMSIWKKQMRGLKQRLHTLREVEVQFGSMFMKYPASQAVYTGLP